MANQVKGLPGHDDTLLQTVTSRRIFLLLQVELMDCPPGFILIKDECLSNASGDFHSGYKMKVIGIEEVEIEKSIYDLIDKLGMKMHFC